MQKLLFILLAFFILFSCKPEPKADDETTNNAARDSLSKVQQKNNADSLKSKNPLLILPPDSNYTGEYVDKYDNGIIKFKGDFRFGKKHGQWMSFYPNGKAWSELHFDKGLRHGPNIAYFEDGKVRYTGYYKNDVRDSVWLYYDTIGKLAQKVLFKNDRVINKTPGG